VESVAAAHFESTEAFRVWGEPWLEGEPWLDGEPSYASTMSQLVMMGNTIGLYVLNLF